MEKLELLENDLEKLRSKYPEFVFICYEDGMNKEDLKEFLSDIN